MVTKKGVSYYLTVLLLLAATLSGCGGGNSGTSTQTGLRISRQDLKDSSHTTTKYWVYQYDSSGYLSEAKYYNAASELINTEYYSYTNGIRSQIITKDASNSVISSKRYTYDESGLLSKVTIYSSNGAVRSYNTYIFDQKKKITTNSYSSTGVYLGKTDFTYDAQNGKRLSSTIYDSSSNVTGTSQRIYSNGVLSEIQNSADSTTTYRVFTYEPGTSHEDIDMYFEF